MATKRVDYVRKCRICKKKFRSYRALIFPVQALVNDWTQGSGNICPECILKDMKEVIIQLEEIIKENKEIKSE